MKKRILAVLMCIFVMAAFSGCASETEATETTENTESVETVNRDKLKKVWQDRASNALYIFVDEETGVNYIIFNGNYRGGITPRYRADGSLYVTGN